MQQATSVEVDASWSAAGQSQSGFKRHSLLQASEEPAALSAAQARSHRGSRPKQILASSHARRQKIPKGSWTQDFRIIETSAQSCLSLVPAVVHFPCQSLIQLSEHRKSRNQALPEQYQRPKSDCIIELQHKD